MLALVRIVLAALALSCAGVSAAPPQFAPVVAGTPLAFPRDFGAHPDFRSEWWYVTGWLNTPDGKPLGFQVTFFRAATGHDRADPSRFAPTQLVIAHAALSDPTLGHLLHGQKIARAGLGLAYAKTGDTDVRLDDWTFKRMADGSYRTQVVTRDFRFALTLVPTQTPMLQGDRGFSRKGPQAAEASYYYSQPQLRVNGSITRDGKPVQISGSAWLDHEWSTSMLDPVASGWDWLGANLDDGSALMAFRIRDRNGTTLWAHAALRNAAGHTTQYGPQQVRFLPQRRWRSPRTGADYPVAMRVETGADSWLLTPLLDDQELDARQSSGAVYWEGAVTVGRDGKPAGHGYLELTGYAGALRF